MLRRGPITFPYFSCEHGRATARLLGIIDSRQDDADSQGMTCCSHPDIEDLDGIIFEYDGRPLYMSAPMMCSGFSTDHGLWARTPLFDNLPDLIKDAVLEFGLRTILLDVEGVSDDVYSSTYEVIARQIEALWPDKKEVKSEADLAAESGTAILIEFLSKHLESADFLTLTALAEYINHRAKFVRDRGGNAKPLYALKAAYLNKLITGWCVSSCTKPEAVALGRDENLISVVSYIRIPVFSDLSSHYVRAFHMKPQELAPDLVTILQDTNPRLATELKL